MLHDDEAVVRLQSDLTEHYGADIRDFWKPNSPMTLGWLISHINQLPREARIWRHIVGERMQYGHTEHILHDLRDLIVQMHMFLQYTAGALGDKKSYRELIKHIPEPTLRPGQEPPKKEFATPEQLKNIFGLGRPSGR